MASLMQMDPITIIAMAPSPTTMGGMIKNDQIKHVNPGEAYTNTLMSNFRTRDETDEPSTSQPIFFLSKNANGKLLLVRNNQSQTFVFIFDGNTHASVNVIKTIPTRSVY